MNDPNVTVCRVARLFAGFILDSVCDDYFALARHVRCATSGGKEEWRTAFLVLFGSRVANAVARREFVCIEASVIGIGRATHRRVRTGIRSAHRRIGAIVCTVASDTLLLPHGARFVFARCQVDHYRRVLLAIAVVSLAVGVAISVVKKSRVAFAAFVLGQQIGRPFIARALDFVLHHALWHPIGDEFGFAEGLLVSDEDLVAFLFQNRRRQFPASRVAKARLDDFGARVVERVLALQTFQPRRAA